MYKVRTLHDSLRLGSREKEVKYWQDTHSSLMKFGCCPICKQYQTAHLIILENRVQSLCDIHLKEPL